MCKRLWIYKPLQEITGRMYVEKNFFRCVCKLGRTNSLLVLTYPYLCHLQKSQLIPTLYFSIKNLQQLYLAFYYQLGPQNLAAQKWVQFLIHL